MDRHQWSARWRNILVNELRKTNPVAFTGPNKMRFAFQGPTEDVAPAGRHLTFNNGVMALVDTPRDTIVLAAFPMWSGPTKSSSADAERAQLTAEARAAAADNDVELLELHGPDGGTEWVYTKTLTATESSFLVGGPPRGVPGGPSDFTSDAIATIEEFANAVARAASVMFADADDAEAWMRHEAMVAAAFAERRAEREAAAAEQPRSQTPEEASAPAPQTEQRGGGCFVASAVYGSYDCPPVWVLRRWRDTRLTTTAAGRALVRVYYTLSPPLVARFGRRDWFVRAAKAPLDRLVTHLTRSGLSTSPYQDQ